MDDHRRLSFFGEMATSIRYPTHQCGAYVEVVRILLSARPENTEEMQREHRENTCTQRDTYKDTYNKDTLKGLYDGKSGPWWNEC
jgi:hypothetical protein